jgi:hypothetical protein
LPPQNPQQEAVFPCPAHDATEREIGTSHVCPHDDEMLPD